MAIFYVDINNSYVTNGDGTSANPLNLTQMINYHYSATNDLTFYLNGHRTFSADLVIDTDNSPRARVLDMKFLPWYSNSPPIFEYTGVAKNNGFHYIDSTEYYQHEFVGIAIKSSDVEFQFVGSSGTPYNRTHLIKCCYIEYGNFDITPTGPVNYTSIDLIGCTLKPNNALSYWSGTYLWNVAYNNVNFIDCYIGNLMTDGSFVTYNGSDTFSFSSCYFENTSADVVYQYYGYTFTHWSNSGCVFGHSTNNLPTAVLAKTGQEYYFNFENFDLPIIYKIYSYPYGLFGDDRHSIGAFYFPVPEEPIVVSGVSGSDLVVSPVNDFVVSGESHFPDFANTLYQFDINSDLPNGYITKCPTMYDNERRLFDNVLTEAYNFHGVCMTFYITTYDTNYDRIWGEDNDRRFVRRFEFMGYYTLPREDKLWTKFGIQGTDSFSIFVSKLHFKEASTFGNDLVMGNVGSGTYSDYIPKVGDIIMADYNKYIYEITEVKEEVGMFLLSKQHVWELVVRTYKDEHLQLSATTSASMSYINTYTNKMTDIFDIKPVIEEKKVDVKYRPKINEKSSSDPFAGW